jgi:NAD+ synthase
MTEQLSFDSLKMDIRATAQELETWVREEVLSSMRKKGVVLGLSGGVDSSVCAAICVKALGKDRVLGIFMPEMDSEKDTNSFGEMISTYLGIGTVMEDITPILIAAGCYRRRDDGIRKTFPEFGDGWRSKVVLPSILNSDRLNISNIVIRSPDGEEKTNRMNTASYLQVVAASNFKQRTRKMIEYFHAERLNYAVIGTPNKLEYDLGFFVKYGDGAADIKPIAHLYKTQVYKLAEHYGIPKEIRERPPTTDTYSLPQTQEEFYFSLPYDKMDLALYAFHNGHSSSDLAQAIGVTQEQSERVFKDIRSKMRQAVFLHKQPVLFG